MEKQNFIQFAIMKGKTHIHIMGAPGAGVSTLGKTMAHHYGFPFFDVDDFVWFTDDALPYRRRRNKEHRTELLRSALSQNSSWVLSGSLCGWGDDFIPQFDVLIYLSADKSLRLERIARREELRYGADALLEEGALHSVFEKFKTWAADYESRNEGIRNEAAELTWIAEKIHCPVLFLDANAPSDLVAEQALGFMLKHE